MSDSSPEAQRALAYLREHADEHLRGLDEFLRMESVSADPTSERRRWCGPRSGSRTRFTAIGFEHARLTETRSHPVVTADWLRAGPDKPTVLVYCHYDVQPVDPLEEWIRPPFEPRYENDIVYARGCGDDKGQLYMHLRAAEAWLKGVGHLPINLRVVFEGDEEHISEPVAEFIEAHPELLSADVCIVSDSDMQDDQGTPAITYGLRGIAYWEVKVQGPFQDVHSGSYGGGVDNPANVLARMLASLVDDNGRVTLPGFYDRVHDLTDAERGAFAADSLRHGRLHDGDRGDRADGRRTGLDAGRAPVRTSDVRHQRAVGRLLRARAPRRSSPDSPPPSSAADSSQTRIRARSSG